MKRRTLLGALLAAPVVAKLGSTAAGAKPAGDRIARPIDVVVVGAGAFGGWTALELVRRGNRVTLIDGWGPGNSRASSGGETRVIRAAYGDRIYVRMARRALALWQQNERALGHKLYHRTGVLFMARQAGGDFLSAAAANLAGEGGRHEVLDRGELERRYPQIAFDGIERGLFEPEGGLLLARRACAAVADAFVQAGGTQVRQHARPGTIRNGKMVSVELADGGSIEADTFVFACGPWLTTLFSDVLGDALRVTRQEVLYFGTPPGEQRYDQGRLPIWADLGERLWYGIPGNEDRGFKIADDTRGEVFDPTDGERTVSAESIRAATGYIAGRFPGLAGAPLVESRVCQYTQTPDAHFLVDRHPAAGNVWLVGGGSGHGFKHAPAMGEHVASRVLGQAPVEPLFSLARLS